MPILPPQLLKYAKLYLGRGKLKTASYSIMIFPPAEWAVIWGAYWL